MQHSSDTHGLNSTKSQAGRPRL